MNMTFYVEARNRLEERLNKAFDEYMAELKASVQGGEGKRFDAEIDDLRKMLASDVDQSTPPITLGSRKTTDMDNKPYRSPQGHLELTGQLYTSSPISLPGIKIVLNPSH